MGWLDRLRGKVPTPPVEDWVWLDRDARLAGLRARLGTVPRHTALVVARDRTTFDDLATALSALDVRGRDGMLDLHAALDLFATPGTLALIDAHAASKPAATSRAVDLTVHVIGRAARRSDDDRLLAAIGQWHIGRVVVHSSLDDPLLRPHRDQLQPLLQKLGARADEPIDSPMLTQALRRAQRD